MGEQLAEVARRRVRGWRRRFRHRYPPRRPPGQAQERGGRWPAPAWQDATTCEVSRRKRRSPHRLAGFGLFEENHAEEGNPTRVQQETEKPGPAPQGARQGQDEKAEQEGVTRVPDQQAEVELVQQAKSLSNGYFGMGMRAMRPDRVVPL